MMLERARNKEKKERENNISMGKEKEVLKDKNDDRLNHRILLTNPSIIQLKEITFKLFS